ncbi:MAG TPA: hypothetical protein VG267_01755 [Terracidiphilus sp.]|nr:hypothetical protein [Terracidiphilus sp.]
MKKILSLDAVLLTTLLALLFTSPLTRVEAAAPLPLGQAAAPPATAQTPELKKAMADLAASAAEIDKFLADQAEPAPQLSTRFGSRVPRKCPDVTALPTSAQAVTLVQCTMDYETPQQAKLHQDIAVQLGSSRAPADSDRWPRIDSRFHVVDFSATATVFLCGPVLEAVMHNTGSNCDRYQFENAPGICWKTIDGQYRCQINAGLPTNPTRSQPPPTRY